MKNLGIVQRKVKCWFRALLFKCLFCLVLSFVFFFWKQSALALSTFQLKEKQACLLKNCHDMASHRCTLSLSLPSNLEEPPFLHLHRVERNASWRWLRGMWRDTAKCHSHGRMRNASSRTRVPGRELCGLIRAQWWASTVPEAEFSFQNDDATKRGQAWHLSSPPWKQQEGAHVTDTKNEASKGTCRVSHRSWWSLTGSCLVATRYE